MSFVEERFPEDISNGSTGGPGWKTDVRVISSGYESRRVRWPYPRHHYDAVEAVRTPQQLESLIKFFNAVQGRAYGFRFKDKLDFNTAGYGNTVSGLDVTFYASAPPSNSQEIDLQLFKPYTLGAVTVNRIIHKPVNGTLIIMKNGVAMNEGPSATSYEVDYTTGIVTFGILAFAGGEVITGGFEFDVPCRFDIDQLKINLQGPMIGNTTIPIIEIRPRS